MATPSSSRLTSHPRWPRFVFKVLAVCTAIVLFLAVAGALLQFTESRLEARRYPPPGKLVDIGGVRLHLNCIGEGSPTVIMDAGLGDSSVTWALVQPSVGEFTRVCSYDRAGYGWSDPPNEPRTTANIVSELDRLLNAAGISGHYVLVGHSFGGLNMRMFAARHRDQIAGMVFVDSSHPDQINRLPQSRQTQTYITHYKVGILTMPLGVPRILGWCHDDYTFPNQPTAWTPIAPKAIALDCRRVAWRTTLEELLLFPENARAVGEIGSLGDMPLVVLSHDPTVGAGFPPADAAKAERAWTEMQEELRNLSSQGKRIVATGSGHYVEVYRPELVTQAIWQVVDDVRVKR